MELSVRGTPIEVTKGTVLLLLIGLALLTYGGYDYVQQSDAVDDAVTVEATVVEASVSESTSGRGVSYHPIVEFTYEYRGTEYTGDQLLPGSIESSYDTRSDAESAVEPYDAGTTVTAYVDPAEPSEGFLERRTSGGPVEFVAIGGVVLLVTGLHAVGARRPGHGTELRPASERESEPYRTLLGVDRDTVHRVSTRLIAAAAAVVPLSLIGIVVLLLGTSDGGEPVELDVALTDPVGLLFGTATLAVLVLVVSVLLYCVWSYTEYRRLRERIPEPRPPSPFRRPTRLVTVLLGNYDLDSYGQRVQRTGFALLVALSLVGGLLGLLVF